MYLKKYRIHFVGIGGIGMSGIAELLLNLGYRVSGSDLKPSEITARLISLGAIVTAGHRADSVEGADVVVISSAVQPGNPEVLAAQHLSIPVIPRAEMLAELMRLKYSIAVAGAHGKTTTTSIVAAVLAAGGLDPTAVIGGKLMSLGTNAVLGKGDFIVAEADESDGSFLSYAPAIAVVTNIDREHLDFYPDLEAIQQTFLQFIDRLPFYGLAVLCLDNEPTQAILPKVHKRHTTYGMSPQADFQIAEVAFEGCRSRFGVRLRGQPLGRFHLNLPGVHNVYNATAGIAVGLELGIPVERIQAALEEIAGVQRRLEVKGETGGVIVVDDYGHHPTEIKTTLEAAKVCWPERRMVVVFQPHRYSRTRALFEEFTRAFNQSQLLCVLPVYAAGEEPIKGVNGQALCEGIKAHGHKQVVWAEDLDAAAVFLKGALAPGDLLLTLGAGDVWKIGERLLGREASK